MTKTTLFRRALVAALCAALLLALAIPAAAAPKLGKNQLEFPSGDTLAIRVNCGGEFEDPHWCYTDQDKNLWVGDQVYLEGRQWGATGGGGVFRSEQDITVVKNTKAPGMLMAERYGMEKYTFAVPAGSYTVRLHFMEGYLALYQPGTRVFTVGVNGKPVAEHLDVMKEAGEIATAVVREAKGVQADGGKIEIAFTKETTGQGPIVNGIEILGESPLAAPFAFLLGDPAGTPPAPLPDLGKPLFRVNCGMEGFLTGYQYMLDGDAVWLPDQPWKDGAEYGAVGGDPGSPRAIAEARTPISRAVFCLERPGVTAYKFKVPPSGTYRVRASFAETWKDNNAPGKRLFDIAIGGKTLAEGVDPFALAGGLGKPAHVDLPAASPDQNGILEVQFLAGKTPQGVIVNGIEVFQAGP